MIVHPSTHAMPQLLIHLLGGGGGSGICTGIENTDKKYMVHTLMEFINIKQKITIALNN